MDTLWTRCEVCFISTSIQDNAGSCSVYMIGMTKAVINESADLEVWDEKLIIVQFLAPQCKDSSNNICFEKKT